MNAIIDIFYECSLYLTRERSFSYSKKSLLCGCKEGGIRQIRLRRKRLSKLRPLGGAIYFRFGRQS